MTVTAIIAHYLLLSKSEQERIALLREPVAGRPRAGGNGHAALAGAVEEELPGRSKYTHRAYWHPECHAKAHPTPSRMSEQCPPEAKAPGDSEQSERRPPSGGRARAIAPSSF